MKKLFLSLFLLSTAHASEIYSDAFIIQDVKDRSSSFKHNISISQSLNQDVYNITSVGYTYDYFINHFVSIAPELQLHRREMKESHKSIVSLIEKQPQIVSHNPDLSIGCRVNFLPISGIGNLLNRKELGMSFGTAFGASLDKYKDFVSPGGYFGININFEAERKSYSVELRQTARMSNDYFDHYTSISFSISFL